MKRLSLFLLQTANAAAPYGLIQADPLPLFPQTTDFSTELFGMTRSRFERKLNACPSTWSRNQLVLTIRMMKRGSR